MTDSAVITAHLRRILGAGAGIAVVDPAHPSGPLLPGEEPAIARAVPARRLEFTAGRVAARAALTQIGHPAVAIPSAPDRSPIWPAGIAGSITHCDDICIAVIVHGQTLRGVGIDIEPNTPLPRDLRDVICTQSERAWLESRPAAQHGKLAKQFFCAKESAYKAIYPLTKTLIEFSDMHITFGADKSRFTAETNGAPEITGHLLDLPRHILCLSVVHAGAEPASRPV